MAEAVFVVAAVLMLVGAVGVVGSRNPVHAALFLVQTLVGVALLFVLNDRSLPGRGAGGGSTPGPS